MTATVEAPTRYPWWTVKDSGGFPPFHGYSAWRQLWAGAPGVLETQWPEEWDRRPHP